jgi:hypothetical protein
MTLTIEFGSDSRGVSDVVGYVLIFSLITATVGVVTVVGFGTLEDRQAAERINNVERAFDVFSNNMENVYRDGAPSRATEMRLAGGTLRHGDSVTITIEADSGENVTAVSSPLVYEDGSSRIVYSAGAILRTDGEASVMLRDPPFRTNLSTASFPLIEMFRTSGAQTVSMEGTVRVTSTARQINTTVPPSFSDPSAGGYNITIETPRGDAWERYFDSQPGTDVLDRDSDRVTAKINQETVVAPRFPIRVRFSE